MLKNFYKGNTIEINLPEEYGYKDYSVKCTYRYVKSKEKYLLSMWLKYKVDTYKFKIESQEIDTQLISGTKETIVDNITRIVEQASFTGYFDKFIKDYEYTYECFNRGCKLFEEEKELHGDSTE